MKTVTVALRDLERSVPKLISARMRGERFAVRFAFHDLRLVGFQRLCEIAWRLPEAERERAFAQIDRLEPFYDRDGNRMPFSPWVIGRVPALAAIARLAEAVVVRSDVERWRHREVLGSELAVMPAMPLGAPAETDVPARLPAAVKDAIVLWAGRDHPRCALHHLHTLKNVGLPLLAVAAEPFPTPIGSWVPLADGAAALARARVVVQCSHAPDDGVALARLGIPLVVAYGEGVDEFASNVTLHYPHISRDEWRRTLNGLCAGSPAVAELPPPDPLHADELLDDGPPVVLRQGVGLGEAPDAATRGSLAAQTYRRLGTDDTTARYTGVLANGAVVFPDHVARLVTVLERSGAAEAVAPALRRAAAGTEIVEDAFLLRRRGAERGGRVGVTTITGSIP